MLVYVNEKLIMNIIVFAYFILTVFIIYLFRDMFSRLGSYMFYVLFVTWVFISLHLDKMYYFIKRKVTKNNKELLR